MIRAYGGYLLARARTRPFALFWLLAAPILGAAWARGAAAPSLDAFLWLLGGMGPAIFLGHERPEASRRFRTLPGAPGARFLAAFLLFLALALVPATAIVLLHGGAGFPAAVVLSATGVSVGLFIAGWGDGGLRSAMLSVLAFVLLLAPHSALELAAAAMSGATETERLFALVRGGMAASVFAILAIVGYEKR